jgi:hypothetical protein
VLGLIYTVMFCVGPGIYSYVLCWVWYIQLCFVLGVIYTVMFCVGSGIYSYVLCWV